MGVLCQVCAQVNEAGSPCTFVRTTRDRNNCCALHPDVNLHGEMVHVKSSTLVVYYIAYTLKPVDWKGKMQMMALFGTKVGIVLLLLHVAHLLPLCRASALMMRKPHHWSTTHQSDVCR